MPHSLIHRLCIVLAVTSVCTLAATSKAEDLTCLKTEEGVQYLPVTWYGELQKRVDENLKQRLARVEALKSAADIEAYQRAQRETMLAQLGDFPERTSLEPKIVGTIRREGFRIEKVIFQSQPQHHITANLYLPDGQGPYPGVIVSSGHSRTGKTADYNQRFGIAMAQNGIAALCYDPIGQGERSQVLNDSGKPAVEATTEEHFLVGSGSILVGRNTATYRIWDAMRALDYLESRTDIDKSRLGMMGCSGGGTLTSYTMALDDRIFCAAPACYITTFSHLISTLGPQDSEQNIYAQLALGLDQPDYILMRAPKPTLISATSSDFFGISGTWDSFRQCKRIYTRLGMPERIDIVEADGEHGVQPANLAAITHWMKRWLLNSDAQIATPVKSFDQYPVLPEKDLLCTPRGQVLLLENEKSVYQLNHEIAEKFVDSRKASGEIAADDLRSLVRKTLAITDEDSLPLPISHRAGKVQRDGYHIDKLVIRQGDRTPLPALTFHPQDPAEAAYIYLSDGGKIVDTEADSAVEKLVDQGFVVLTVDLRGQGETADGKPHPTLGDWRTFYLAYLSGQSVVAAHTEDILTAATWAANYQSEKPREVHLIANGNTTVAAIHAVALKPQLFTSLSLKNAPKSWLEMTHNMKEAERITTTVHGALRSYDLPDLLKLIPPAKLKQ